MDTDTLITMKAEERQEQKDYTYRMCILTRSLKEVDSRFKIVRKEEDLSYLLGNVY